MEAIRCGRIAVAQADGYKLVLAENRYTMPFASFAVNVDFGVMPLNSRTAATI